jgi:hypothetical protein
MNMKHPRLASLDSLKGAAPAARQSRFRGALGWDLGAPKNSVNCAKA